MRKFFTEKLSTVLAFGSEVGRWSCQLKEIYELEKMDCLYYYLEVSLWTPRFWTPPGHTEIQWEPQADALRTDSQFHLCFSICNGVCTGIGENPSTKPKMKHPEFDIVIPSLPMPCQQSLIRHLSGLCLKQLTKWE